MARNFSDNVYPVLSLARAAEKPRPLIFYLEQFINEPLKSRPGKFVIWQLRKPSLRRVNVQICCKWIDTVPDLCEGEWLRPRSGDNCV